jgi:hypothetical protein
VRNVRMPGKSRLKAGCSQDWPPHKCRYLGMGKVGGLYWID